MTVSLRAPTDADRDRVLEWRNEPTTRAMSRTQHVITPEEHARWWTERRPAEYFIIEADDIPVGVVSVSDDWGEVNINIASGSQRQGIGTRALILLKQESKRRRLIARIAPENIASRIAFYRAGFVGRFEVVTQWSRP